MTACMWRWRNSRGVSCGRVMSACIMPCMSSTPGYSGLQIISHDGRERLGQRHSSQRSSGVSLPFYPIHPVIFYPNVSMHNPRFLHTRREGQFWVLSLDSVYEYERAISENAHGTLLMHNTRSASGESHGVHHQLLSEPPMHAL